MRSEHDEEHRSHVSAGVEAIGPRVISADESAGEAFVGVEQRPLGRRRTDVQVVHERQVEARWRPVVHAVEDGHRVGAVRELAPPHVQLSVQLL